MPGKFQARFQATLKGIMLFPTISFPSVVYSPYILQKKLLEGYQSPNSACCFRSSSFPNPLTALRTHARLAKDSYCSAGYTAYSRTRARYLGAGNHINHLVGSEQSFRSLVENRVWLSIPLLITCIPSCSHYADFDVQGFALDS